MSVDVATLSLVERRALYERLLAENRQSATNDRRWRVYRQLAFASGLCLTCRMEIPPIGKRTCRGCCRAALERKHHKNATGLCRECRTEVEINTATGKPLIRCPECSRTHQDYKRRRAG